jgi:hypothetical protein
MADHINRHPPRVEEKAAQDRRNRMGLELESSDNAEVSTSATERPEEVIVLRRAGSEHSAISCDHLRRQQIVDGHPVLTNQPANTASEGQATNTRLGYYADRNRKPEDMRFSVKIAKSRSALYSNSPGCIMYENGPHLGKVYHQSVVTERTAADVVPTAPNRRQQIIRASEIDRGNHISHASAPSDQSGTFIDTCVPDLAGLVVANIRRLENLPVKYRPERFDVDNGHNGEKLYSNNRK